MEEKEEKKVKKVYKVEKVEVEKVVRIKEPVLPKLKADEIRLGDGIVITQDNWNFKTEGWLKKNRPEVYKKYVK